MRTIQILGLVMASLWIGGCSISVSVGASLEGSSASISSPFESSSASSTPAQPEDKTAEQQAYLRDIRDFTAAQLKRSDDLAEFRKQLSKVAKKHGVTDWEARASTWVGIGEGIETVGMPSTQAQATIDMLANGHADWASAMRRGYDSAQVAAGVKVSS
jgi:hypothetical protein